MPEYGSDADLAATLVTGDQQALGELYNRYSGRIFSYCVSVCGNPDQAADAMQDSFLLAYARIGQLRDPSKLRPWLYAIARNECLRQLRANKRNVDLEQAGEVADVTTDLDTDLNASDARLLIDDAFAGMNSSDREVLDLALRQDLDNSAIAAVLGVSDNNAAAKVSRAKSQLEKAVGALMLFRGRATVCDQLDTEIGPDKAFTPLARKRISRHAEDCSNCSKSRSKSVAAIALAGLPLLAAPSVVREALFNSAVPNGGGVTTASGGDGVPDVTSQVSDPSGSGSSGHTGQGTPEAHTDAGPNTQPGSQPDGVGQTPVDSPPSQADAPPSPGDGPVYIAQTQGKIPPLPLKDKAAQLDKARPAFDKNGWPLAGGKPKKRWPLVAAIAAVVVVMTAATGVAVTSNAEVPAAGQTQTAVPPIAVPSPTPPPVKPPPSASKNALSSSASSSPSASVSSGSSVGGTSGGSSKPTSKPKPSTPKPSTPKPPTSAPTPGGPGGAPGGPGGIAAPPAPIPG